MGTVNNNNTVMKDNTFQRFVLVIISGCLSLVMSYSTGGYLPPVSPGHVSQSYPGHVSPGHVSSLSSEYSSPPCSEYFHAQFPTCSQSNYGVSAQNCSMVIESMYTIEYKEECGRRYNKVCYGPDNSGCKAVVDPGCYQVPTHSPVQVPREICYNPSTGERCDNYNKQFADSYPVRCSQ